MTPLAHIATVTEAVRTSMLEWVEGLMASAGLEVPVSGGLQKDSATSTLVLLPYQMVMESQAGVPEVPLMPMTGDGRHSGAIPAPWRALAKGMTQVLVDQYPKRAKKGPGLGPLDPCPRIDELPGPLKTWYEAHEDWHVQGGRGLLPQISWRQPFSLVIRYTAMVLDDNPGSDLMRLQALAVLAGGIRQQRYFETEVPPGPQETVLADLVDAFAASAPEPLGAELAEAAEASRSAYPLAVGLFPHNDLTDNDLALVMQALRVPMQPALVFGARLSLGAGPVLLTGAMPHLSPVEGARR